MNTIGKAPRWQWLDIWRGVAILAMVVFHFAWDLYYFGYSPVDVTAEPRWVAFQKTILACFLLVSGASFALSHGAAIRWDRFWRRLAFLVVAALAVTGGTYLLFPDYFVFFGVLHAIAAFSLLALLFIGLDGRVICGVGVALVAVAFTHTDPAFSERQLSWIGFWPISPPTTDVVPIFPWFGVFLIGAGALKALRASRFSRWLDRPASEEPVLRGVALIGRWSLLIYLVHQLLLLGLLWCVFQVSPPALQEIEVAPPPSPDAEVLGYTQKCEEQAAASGMAAPQSTAYCGCALEQMQQTELWQAVSSGTITDAQNQQLKSIGTLCRAMTTPAK